MLFHVGFQFEHASQFVEVAQDTVNQRPEVENLYNQKITREQIEADLRQIMGELLAETPSTTQQVDEVHNHRDDSLMGMINCNYPGYLMHFCIYDNLLSQFLIFKNDEKDVPWRQKAHLKCYNSLFQEYCSEFILLI